MSYRIDAELTSSRLDSALKTEIVSGNNRTLITTIPVKDGQPIVFEEKEPLKISYYHGEFVYSFQLLFHEKIADNDMSFYEFTIDEVNVDNNYRKHKREIVNFKGLVMVPKEIIYITVLDISESGLKFETDVAIDKRKLEIHYADENNETRRVKGKVVWSKKINDEKYHYGMKFK